MQIGARLVRTPAELDIAYQCHHDWFLAAAYIEPHASGRYTDEFTDRADYFMIYDQAQTPYLTRENALGLIRIVHDKPFRTFEEFELARNFQYLKDIPDHEICELSALSWTPQIARVAIPHLMRPLYYYSTVRGRRYGVCNLDNRVCDLLRMMRYPLNPCGLTRQYMGSMKTPIMLDASEVGQKLAAQNPKAWEIACLSVEVDDEINIGA